MLKIDTEFRKGIMFVRPVGSLNKNNINKIVYDDFKYIVINFDNLLSIDSYAISYIIEYGKKMKNNDGKLVICDSKNNKTDNFFVNKIPIIDNELRAFNSM